MSIKRYDFDCITSDYLLGASLGRTEVADGDYVRHTDYAALLARHNALREAVAWERECIRQLDYVGKFWDDDNVPGRALILILDAARAEVDRLLSEDSNDGNS